MACYLFHGVVLAVVDAFDLVDAAEGAFTEFGLHVELVEFGWVLHSNNIGWINRNFLQLVTASKLTSNHLLLFMLVNQQK